MRNKALALLTLFTSASTLVCCALPALFVTLGMGAAFAGLVSKFPQLVILSEHKTAIFLFAGFALAIAGVSQWRARNLPCPIDPALAQACSSARTWAKWTYFVSILIYLVGAGFALIPQLFTDRPSL